MEPSIVRAKNGALKRTIREAVEKSPDTGEQHFCRNTVGVLIPNSRTRFPRCRKIFVLKIFVKVNPFVVLVHINAAKTSRFADHVPNRIVGAGAGRKTVRYHPDSFESLRIFDHLRRSIAVFFLYSLPRGGRLVDMSVGGDQFELGHLILLAAIRSPSTGLRTNGKRYAPKKESVYAD